MVYKLIEPKFGPDERPFFAGFPGFRQDPKASVSAEFARLAKSRGWKPGTKKWKTSWFLCIDAEYDRLIGDRSSSLELWQELCRKLDLDGDLPSIRKCRMVGLSCLLPSNRSSNSLLHRLLAMYMSTLSTS